MKEKGIDPNNMEETLKHFMEDDVSEGNDGTDIEKSGLRLPLRHKVCPGKMERKSNLLCRYSSLHF
ncbi:hypothetical protein EVA_15377 [gut metagenome]|uniref:Uncharacterized protein n=1 Tax=gut metagenome TaxID=749906 RepID=J9GAR7_9ZZZZ